MPLQQGEVQGYDFNRSVVEFTMLNQGKVILCAISTTAMDDIEGKRNVRPDQRVDQFMRLREVIEERASRKTPRNALAGNIAGDRARKGPPNFAEEPFSGGSLTAVLTIRATKTPKANKQCPLSPAPTK